jgi:hypothetical protein
LIRARADAADREPAFAFGAGDGAPPTHSRTANASSVDFEEQDFEIRNRVVLTG